MKLQAGKIRKMKHEQAGGGADGLGVNIRFDSDLFLFVMFAMFPPPGRLWLWLC